MADRTQVQAGQTLADTVEVVLLAHDGGPILLRSLVDELGIEHAPMAAQSTSEYAVKASLVAPEHQVAQAILEDDRRRTAQGKRPRFVIEDNESVRLRTPATAAEDAVAKENDKVKADLLAQLQECDPTQLEEIVGELIRAMGYEDVRVSQQSKDRGIDVLATFFAGGTAHVSTGFQVKRTKGTVGRGVVQSLRGAVDPGQHGVIVTTGRFSLEAIEDARRHDRTAIHLIDGPRLVDLMVEHGLGVRTSSVVLIALQEEFFIESPDGAQAIDRTYDVRAAAAHANRRYFLAQLPGGRNANYLSTLAQMAQLAEKRPDLETFIALFQQRFPTISRADEARRRMRVLLSLGLAEVDSDRVTLTYLGRRFLDERSPEILGDAFLARIAGASEIRELVRGAATSEERKARLQKTPPAGLSDTQANLVLRWLTQLELID